MKIAASYENIHDGVRATGRRMEDVLKELRDAGMEMLYLSPDSWKRDRKELHVNTYKRLGIQFIHRNETLNYIRETFEKMEVKILDQDFHAENMTTGKTCIPMCIRCPCAGRPITGT